MHPKGILDEKKIVCCVKINFQVKEKNLLQCKMSAIMDTAKYWGCSEVASSTGAASSRSG